MLHPDEIEAYQTELEGAHAVIDRLHKAGQNGADALSDVTLSDLAAARRSIASALRSLDTAYGAACRALRHD